jgi:hypothetical protein
MFVNLWRLMRQHNATTATLTALATQACVGNSGSSKGQKTLFVFGNAYSSGGT